MTTPRSERTNQATVYEYRRGRHGFREYTNPPVLSDADVVKVRAMLTHRFPNPVEREQLARMIGVERAQP